MRRPRSLVRRAVWPFLALLQHFGGASFACETPCIGGRAEHPSWWEEGRAGKWFRMRNRTERARGPAASLEAQRARGTVTDVWSGLDSQLLLRASRMTQISHAKHIAHGLRC